MSWRDDLRQASFRGVPFFTAATEKSGGVRGQVHEIPLRDEPFVEEFGRRARRFRIEAYLLGDDVFEQRTRLEDALEAGGPGELVEHFRGTIRARCRSYRTRESTRDGGMVRISIEFVEAGVAAPDEGVDTTGRVAASTAAASSTLQGTFGSVFNVRGFPDFVATAAETLVGATAGAVSDAVRLVEGERAEIAKLNARVSALAATASTIILDPTDLATEISGTIADLHDVAASPRSAIAALQALTPFGLDLPVIPTTIASRAQQRANQYQNASLVRRSAILELARATSSVDFASYDDAVTERERIAELLDAEMLIAGECGDDDGYAVLRDVYNESVLDITTRGATLDPLIAVTPAATLPDVVIAYQLYGDAERATEIGERNRVRHPAFVPGGEALEVLSDAGIG